MNLKNTAISILILIAIFAGGVLVGKHYFSKTDIKVIDKVVYKTVWKEKPAPDLPFTQENFNNLLYCVNSDIIFKDKTDKNYLYVTAYDECKEATARYEIGSKGDWRFYVGFGIAGAAAGGYLVYKLLR